MSGKRSPFPVARPIRSARSACGPAAVKLVEVELGRREMRKRVEPSAELVVRETVDERGGFGAKCLSVYRASGHRTREGAYRERRRDQRLVVEQFGRIDRPARPGAHRVVVAVVEAVAGELDHELDALRGVGVSELGERALEVGVRLHVPAEKMLDARARSGEADAQRLRFLGDDVHALEERCMAFAELAGRSERFGTRQQQLDAPVVGRSRRKETEGRSEPACGAPRCTRGRRLSSLSQ